MPDLHALLLQNIGTIATGVGSLLAIVILWWLRKHFVPWKVYNARQIKIDNRFAEHELRLTKQGQQLTSVEGVTATITDALRRLPQREDMLKLEISLTELRGNLQGMEATFNGVKALVERQEAQTTLLHEHLLTMGK